MNVELIDFYQLPYKASWRSVKLLLLVCFLILVSCKNQEEAYLILNGKIINSNRQTIYISRYFLDGSPEKLIDSILIKSLDSDFTIHIPVSSSEGSILKLNLDRNASFVYLDDAPGTKQVEINMTNLSSYSIKGSPADIDFSRHYFLTRIYSDSLYFLNNFHHNESSSKKRDSLDQIIQRIQSALHDLNIRFALDSTSQPKVTLKIALETDFSSDLNGFKSYLQKFESKYQSDSFVINYISKGRSYLHLMEHSYKLSEVIPDIELTIHKDIKAGFYNSSKKKNLLFFWAGYSEKSLDLLRKLSLIAIDQNTQVFSFSLDPDSSSFKAIVDRLPAYWIHAYDFDSWNGRLARHFLVKDIPYFFILDSAHIIQYMGSDLVLE